jgi:hypothetical protein
MDSRSWFKKRKITKNLAFSMDQATGRRSTDANDDLRVDEEDLAVWQNSLLSEIENVGASVTTPEPSPLNLLIVAIVFMCLASRDKVDLSGARL